MILGLKRASDEKIQELRKNPKLIHDFLHESYESLLALGSKPVGTPPAPTGFFARLFGRKQTAPVRVPTSQALASWKRPDDETDLDKAWHGIHFLLAGTEEGADWPTGFLLNGGAEIGKEDVGYGPARALTAQKTAEVAAFLKGIPVSDLRSRYDPTAMAKAEIYPGIWDDEDEEAWEYLEEYYQHLCEFVEKTAAEGQGLVIHLG